MGESVKIVIGCVVLFCAGIPIGTALIRPSVEPEEATVTLKLDELREGDPIPDLLTLSHEEYVVMLGRMSSSALRNVIRDLRSDDLSSARHQLAQRAALATFGAKEPARFLRWVEHASLPLLHTKPAIETAAAALAANDAEEGFAALEAIDSFNIRLPAWKAYVSELAVRDPKRAVLQLLAANRSFGPSYEERFQWGGTREIKDQVGMQSHIAGSIVGASWGATDPSAAADFFAGLRLDHRNTMRLGIRNVMQQWAHKDPRAAHAWLAEQTDPFVRTFATSTFLQAMVVDPRTAELALEFISELPKAADRKRMNQHLGEHFAKHGNVDGSLLAKAIERGKPFEREQMMAGLTGVMPSEVAVKTITSLQGQTYRGRAIDNAIRATSSREEGLAIVTALETPLDRRTARDDLVKHHANKNTHDAVQVAFTSESTRERTRHLDTLAEQLIHRKFARTPSNPMWFKNLEPSQQVEVRAAIDMYLDAHSQSTSMPDALRRVLE